jgi:esterase
MIILHGLYGMSDNWMSVAKALSDDFEVWLPDWRNHGNSPHDAVHDYGALKQDLLEFMDEHGLQKAILAGHSMGGKAVMHFALDHPERISALIVIDISPRAYTDDDRSSDHSIDHATIIEGMMGVDIKRAKSRRDVETQLSWYIPSQRIRKFLLKNVDKDQAGQLRWKLNLRVLLDNLPVLFGGIDPPGGEGSGGITGFPVLFIKGEKSGYISPDDYALIKKIFPEAEITTIPGAGHWLHAEQPGLLVKTIKYFLQT